MSSYLWQYFCSSFFRWWVVCVWVAEWSSCSADAVALILEPFYGKFLIPRLPFPHDMNPHKMNSHRCLAFYSWLYADVCMCIFLLFAL